MADSTVVEGHLKHVLTWTLTELEDLCKEVTAEVESVWPTLEHLVTSGDLGRDIISILATLKPVTDFAKENFPMFASLIDWVISILDRIAKFDAVLSQCNCFSCSI